VGIGSSGQLVGRLEWVSLENYASESREKDGRMCVSVFLSIRSSY